MNSKIKYISISRGIAICLVVIGHCISGKINNFIYLFHMPFFFMISGYLFNIDNSYHIYTYCRKKIKKLYFPYVFWNLVFLIFHNTFFDIGFYQEGFMNLRPITSIKEFCIEVFKIITLTHMEQVTAPTWYLRVVLFSSILFAIAYKYLKQKVIFFISLFLFLCIYILKYLNISNINSLTIYSCLILLGFVFMCFGKMYKLIENKIEYHNYMILIVLIILLILNNYGHINIVSLDLQNPIYLISTSFLGIYFLLCISKKLQSLKIQNIFIYIGDNTLIILILHCFVFKLINLIYSYIYNDTSYLKNISNATDIYWAIIYIVAGIVIPLVVGMLINRFKSILKHRLINRRIKDEK